MQNVSRAVNLSTTNAYLLFQSLSFNVSKSSGNFNSNLASVTSNFGLGLRQFERLRQFYTKFEIPSKHDIIASIIC